MTHSLATFLVRLLLISFVVFQLAGCGVLILGGAAAGTVGYVSGDLNATIEGGFEKVVEASDAAIRENSIREITRDASQHQVAYELRTPQDDKILLTISRASKDLTNVTIRVGVFGDEPLSHRILEEIKTRVK
ncbi:DUF3568 family protein [Thermodesulfobacteriota bacterium]